MDKLMNYRQLIKTILTERADFDTRVAPQSLETHAIIDEINDRYLLLRAGWYNKTRIRSVIIYLRLENGKIWVEEDWTEEGVTATLLNAGVPKEDIVLAFHPPEKRPFTEFAVA